MNAWKFLSRSLAYYARSHFGTLMGACIASAVLTGALMVGDSVRGSLPNGHGAVGKVDTAIVGNDRLFQEDLAQRMQDPTFAKVSPALQLPAVSALQGGDYRSNQSWLFGVKNTFWDMATDPDLGLHPSPGEVALGVAWRSNCMQKSVRRSSRVCRSPASFRLRPLWRQRRAKRLP